jgi:Spy/CpxP family protein refolding chaperone
MKTNLMKFVFASAFATGLAVAQAPAPAPRAGQGLAAQQGQAPGGRAAMMRGMVQRRLMRALNLTDAQREQARAIFQQSRQNARPIADQLRQNRQSLAEAVQANNVALIQSLSAQAGTLQGQLLAIRSEAMAKFLTTLTPEQRTRANEMRERVKERLQQRRSRANG